MRRTGFTIIESMLATVVLATAVLGISSALAASAKQSEMIREQGTLLHLAKSLAEEVASVPFTDGTGSFGNGWNAGNHDRHTYDDVFDFNGYNDAAPFDPLVSGGQRVSYPEGYRRWVQVDAMATPSTTAVSLAVSKFAKITITTVAPSGRQVVLHRWVSRVEIDR